MSRRLVAHSWNGSRDAISRAWQSLGHQTLKEVLMARITLRQLLDHAAEHDYGVPAFNINNMEQGLAIMEAAAAVDAPVIIQASRGARSYANDIMLSKMIDALEEMYPQIPLCMHQDHGNEEATCATAIKYGFTSVMMDGSLTVSYTHLRAHETVL